MTTLVETPRSEPIGLVLVGGKSSRMKSAKAHLSFGEQPQWRVCEELLLPSCQSVYFSVSPQLVKAIPVEKHRLISDIFVEPIGPLGGIMSAFKKQPEAAFFVLACDLPFFDKMAAQFLLRQRNLKKKATVFVKDDEIEPLCGIYEPAIFLDLAKSWSRGIYCPRRILSGLDVERVSAADEKWLTNINHAHELVELLKVSAGTKTVVVNYYASLREETKRSQEQMETSVTTLGELFLELKKKYGLTMDERALRFAKNDRLVSKDEPIEHNDSIVFIPPVSGG